MGGKMDKKKGSICWQQGKGKELKALFYSILFFFCFNTDFSSLHTPPVTFSF